MVEQSWRQLQGRVPRRLEHALQSVTQRFDGPEGDCSCGTLQAVRRPKSLVKQLAALVRLGLLLERKKDTDQCLTVFGQLDPEGRQDLCPRLLVERHGRRLRPPCCSDDIRRPPEPTAEPCRSNSRRR